MRGAANSFEILRFKDMNIPEPHIGQFRPEIKRTKIKLNAAHFLNELRRIMGLKNDSALALKLGVAIPTISKVRCRQQPITAAILLRAHEASDLSIADLRRIMGDEGIFFDSRRQLILPRADRLKLDQ